MRKRICVISLALPIETDPRTLRQVEYLAKEFDITLIGFGNLPSSLQNITWKPIDRTTSQLRLLYEYLLLFIARIVPAAYRLWLNSRPRYQKSLQYALESHADAYHASDWATLYIAGEAARHYNAKLVFDADEYWPLFNETSRIWMMFFAPLIRYVLRQYSRDVDMTINVSQPIAERFKTEYGLNYILVYNAPELQRIPAHPIDPNRIRLIHHGSALRNRHLEVMIQTVPLLDERFTLDLLLAPVEPDYLESLKSLARELAPERIVFHEPIKMTEIVKYIAEFDLGLCYIAPTTYNWEMAMPNKLFEFIVAGLAVVAGPSPAMAQLIRDEDIGWVASGFAPQDLAITLNGLTYAQIQSARESALEAAKLFNAEVEIGKVLSLYHQSFSDGLLTISA